MKKKRQKVVQVATRVPPEVYGHVAKACQQEGISVSDYVRRLVLRSVQVKQSNPKRAAE